MPFPALAAAGIGAAGNIGAGIIGAIEQSNARGDIKEAYEKSVRDLEAIGIPSIEAQQIVMEEYKSQGNWTPELEEAVQLGETSMAGITTDPSYREAQLKALGKLQQIGDEGGMLLEDRANLERTMGGIAAKQRGAREAILQDARQRGGYGSGTALAAQLMAQQQGSQDARLEGLNTAAQAQSRALQAIQGAGKLGTELRGQEFGEKERIAKAKDVIAQWNAANRQDVNQRNTGVRNQASQYNLNNAQNLANANVDQRNKAQTYNKGLIQQRFGNEMDIAKAKATARAGQAQAAGQAGNAAAQMWGNIGSGIGQAGTAVGQYLNEGDEDSGSTVRSKGGRGNATRRRPVSI